VDGLAHPRPRVKRRQSAGRCGRRNGLPSSSTRPSGAGSSRTCRAWRAELGRAQTHMIRAEATAASTPTSLRSAMDAIRSDTQSASPLSGSGSGNHSFQRTQPLKQRGRSTMICPDCGEPMDATDECLECGAHFTTECNLCERTIEKTRGPALCDYCKGVCKAHARLDRATAEWIADGRPD